MGTNLGDLLRQAGMKSDAPDTPEPAEPQASAAEEATTYGPKVVVRYTRKGRGGRTVTLISGVTAGQDRLLADLKQQLGVGARREDDDLVLQGNQVERVARWLESNGAKKVVRG